MNKKSTNRTIHARFRKVFDYLMEQRKIKNKTDLGAALGTYNHVINDILLKRRGVTYEQMLSLHKLYDINPNYMFGLSEKMFSTGENTSDSEVQALSNEGNITLVPARAHAGYALTPGDSAYLQQLTRFSLPNMEGQLIAFEISGDSMLPNIANGDIVVCEPIERGEPLKDNAVYVIVTDVVVAKRLQQIKRDNQLAALRLISDNDVMYKPYQVELEEVKQILKVKMRLSSYGIN